MKKFTRLLTCAVIALTVLLSLAACNDNNGGNNGAKTTYTVTFDSRGGSAVKPEEVEPNNKVNKPADPTRTGYAFDNWYVSAAAFTDENKWSFIGFSVTESMTLYANWTPNGYTVLYDANGGTGSIESTSHVYDAAKSLPSNAFTRPGYIFAGYNTSADGSGENYASGESAQNICAGGTVTLYAKWSGESHTVTYDYRMSKEGEIKTQTVTNGIINSCVLPARVSYNFDGWYTAAEGGIKFAGSDAQSIIGADLLENTTLYARWISLGYIESSTPIKLYVDAPLSSVKQAVKAHLQASWNNISNVTITMVDGDFDGVYQIIGDIFLTDGNAAFFKVDCEYAAPNGAQTNFADLDAEVSYKFGYSEKDFDIVSDTDLMEMYLDMLQVFNEVWGRVIGGFKHFFLPLAPNVPFKSEGHIVLQLSFLGFSKDVWNNNHITVHKENLLFSASKSDIVTSGKSYTEFFKDEFRKEVQVEGESKLILDDAFDEPCPTIPFDITHFFDADNTLGL
jgi:uncharacterized repeat protein (TIGR02543 family)